VAVILRMVRISRDMTISISIHYTAGCGRQYRLPGRREGSRRNLGKPRLGRAAALEKV